MAGLPPSGFLTYGCADFNNDRRAEVAIIEGALSGTEAGWKLSIYRIEGHNAIPVMTDAGSRESVEPADPLSLRKLRGFEVTAAGPATVPRRSSGTVSTDPACQCCQSVTIASDKRARIGVGWR